MRGRSNSVWRPNEKGLLSVWQRPHTGGATFNSRGLCRRRPFWPTWRCRHRLRTNVVQFVAKKNSMDRKNKVWPCLLLDDGGPGFWKHEKMYEVDSDLLQKTRFTNLQKRLFWEKFAFRSSSVFTIYISLSQTLIFQNRIQMTKWRRDRK